MQYLVKFLSKQGYQGHYKMYHSLGYSQWRTAKYLCINFIHSLYLWDKSLVINVKNTSISSPQWNISVWPNVDTVMLDFSMWILVLHISLISIKQCSITCNYLRRNVGLYNICSITYNYLCVYDMLPHVPDKHWPNFASAHQSSNEVHVCQMLSGLGKTITTF